MVLTGDETKTEQTPSTGRESDRQKPAATRGETGQQEKSTGSQEDRQKKRTRTQNSLTGEERMTVDVADGGSRGV